MTNGSPDRAINPGPETVVLVLPNATRTRSEQCEERSIQRLHLLTFGSRDSSAMWQATSWRTDRQPLVKTAPVLAPCPPAGRSSGCLLAIRNRDLQHAHWPLPRLSCHRSPVAAEIAGHDPDRQQCFSAAIVAAAISENFGAIPREIRLLKSLLAASPRKPGHTVRPLSFDRLPLDQPSFGHAFSQIGDDGAHRFCNSAIQMTGSE